MKDRPAVVGTAWAGTGNRTVQAGGPQENGSRRAAGTAGARNVHSARGREAVSGTRTTAGAAASAGVAANWQMEQCAASWGAADLSAGQWPLAGPWAQWAPAEPAWLDATWMAGAKTSAQAKSATARLFHHLVICS